MSSKENLMSCTPRLAPPSHVWRWPTALAVLIDAVWLPLTGRSIDPRQLVFVLGVVAGLLALRVFYQRVRSRPRIAATLHDLALFIILSQAMAVLSYLVVATNAPLVDAQVDAWDRALGFDWRALFDFVQAHPSLHLVLHLAYISIMPQIAIALILLGLAGPRRGASEFIGTVVFASIATVVISGFVPVTNACLYYHVPVDILDQSDFALLRAGGVPVIDLGRLQGLIAVPSFHVVMSILLIYAVRGAIRPIAWGFLGLNLIAIASTPSEGGHYLIDVLAGGAVAALSIGLVRRLAQAPGAAGDPALRSLVRAAGSEGPARSAALSRADRSAGEEL
jgi:hypothetical protein